MTSSKDCYRILDASLNRCTEGLRTIEEYTRFIRDDLARSATAKQLRHDVQSVAARLDRPSLLNSRDTPGDVGTAIQADDESQRPSAIDVVGAAISRTQQALRCLEEYGKTIDQDFGKAIETIRYDFYRFAAEVEMLTLSEQDEPGVLRRQKLRTAKLYALVTTDSSEEDFLQHLRRLHDSGVDMFQLRDTAASDRVLFERSRSAARLASELGSLFVVNDRADIAAAADCDGVHVGQDELPAAAARGIIGRDRLLGISTHDMDQVRQAVRDGADCIGCGPMFAGPTKRFDHYVGPAFLTEVSRSRLGIPAFAIGGITSDNIDQIIAAGGTRIAVTAAIEKADDPPAAAKRLKEALVTATP